MIPLKEDVIESYRLFLGREPESDVVIRTMQAQHRSVAQMVANLLTSAEYRMRVAAPLMPAGADLLPVLERARHLAAPHEGFVVDWMGLRLDQRFEVAYASAPALLEPQQLGEAESILCAAALMAAEAADGRFTVLHLGAGWGRWGVVAVASAASRGCSDHRIVAAEPHPDRFAHLKEHLAQNGLDGAANTLLQAAVAPADGRALFPIVDAQAGATAAFAEAEKRDGIVYAEVAAKSIQSILAGIDTPVDLCIVELPEAERVLAPALPAVVEQVRALAVRTGTRSTEAFLHDHLPKLGLRLAADLPCRVHWSGGHWCRVAPGVQHWLRSAA